MEGTLFTESYVKVDFQEEENGLHTVQDCLKYYASSIGDRNAVVFASPKKDERLTVTFSELFEKSRSFAQSLISLGVTRDDIVAINIRPCPEWMYVVFGCMLAGVPAVGLVFTYADGSDLIAIMEKLASCRLLVLDPGVNGENWKIVRRLLDAYSDTGLVKSKQMPHLRYLLGHMFPAAEAGVKQLSAVLKEVQDTISLPTVRPQDIAFLFQTSGSTGVPKLVTHTHSSLAAISRARGATFIKSDTIQFNDRPFNWVGGFPHTVFVGSTRVTVSSFTDIGTDRLSTLVDIMQQERCDQAVMLPPQIHALVKRKATLPKDWPLEFILTGGQPLNKSLCQSIGSCCQSLECVYSSTESLVCCAIDVSDPSVFKEFCCGTALLSKGMEMKIVDENGITVPANTRGELLVKSSLMMKGYFNDPEKTQAAFTKYGWYKTDDIARMDENGLFYVEGRLSNMIISGGMNVFPEVLERSIKTCPGVDSVIVVPVSDLEKYQVICACIILEQGSTTTEDDIRLYCANYHNDKSALFTVLPKFYLLLDSFPETRTGKTSRKELTKLAEDKFGNGC